MKRPHCPNWIQPVAFVTLLMLCMGLTEAAAGGKAGIYGIHMVPGGEDAKTYSRPGWGLGVHVVAPVPQLSNMLAGVAGLEVINLLSDKTEFTDNTTGLSVEQQTSQDYVRFFIGSQIGGHGNGFIRPHAGLNVALVYYKIGTDVVIPDDYNRELEIRQKLRTKDHAVFGYDITLGVDLNFSNKIALDGGVKYLKSFSVPQQLGEGAVTIHPQYFQIYFGIGVSFDLIGESEE